MNWRRWCYSWWRSKVIIIVMSTDGKGLMSDPLEHIETRVSIILFILNTLPRMVYRVVLKKKYFQWISIIEYNKESWVRKPFHFIFLYDDTFTGDNVFRHFWSGLQMECTCGKIPTSSVSTCSMTGWRDVSWLLSHLSLLHFFNDIMSTIEIMKTHLYKTLKFNF